MRLEDDLCKMEWKNMIETSDLPVPSPSPFQTTLTTPETTAFGTKQRLEPREWKKWRRKVAFWSLNDPVPVLLSTAQPNAQSGIGIVVWDFSHTKSAPAIFIYLFIYRFVYESEVLVTWFLVWDVTRLGSSILCRLCFVGGHFFFHLLLLYWFKIFSRCAFNSRGKWKSFSFLTFSLSIFKP